MPSFHSVRRVFSLCCSTSSDDLSLVGCRVSHASSPPSAITLFFEQAVLEGEIGRRPPSTLAPPGGDRSPRRRSRRAPCRRRAAFYRPRGTPSTSHSTSMRRCPRGGRAPLCSPWDSVVADLRHDGLCGCGRKDRCFPGTPSPWGSLGLRPSLHRTRTVAWAASEARLRKDGTGWTPSLSASTYRRIGWTWRCVRPGRRSPSNGTQRV